VLATSLLASNTAAFANDMFLKIDGIKGESTDSKHKDEIEVLAWSWGQSNGAARTVRGKQSAACIQDLHFTKFTDASSPGLIMNGVTGEVAKTAVLVVRKAGKEQQEFLTLTMHNVLVSSFQTGGSGGDANLTESVTLHFESMQGEYRKQKADGTLDAPILFDVTAGSAACQQ
jgi:type VI secretion system secreted protein Hcp